MKTKARLLWKGLLFLIVVVFIFPIIWTFLTSIKGNIDAWSMPPKLAFTATLKNYSIVLFEKNFGTYTLNSIFTCVISTVFAVGMGVPLSYALARTRFRLNPVIFIFVFIAYILPPIVLSIPLYVICAKIGMLDKFSTIIITHTTFTLAFTVWMMKGFFEEVPLEIEESSMVDGCSYMQSFLGITIPMVRAGLLSTVIFSFILSWNDFMYALILTGSRTRLVPVAVAQFLTPHGMFWGQMCAAGIIAILPILLFSIFTRRYLIRGMLAGAIK